MQKERVGCLVGAEGLEGFTGTRVEPGAVAEGLEKKGHPGPEEKHERTHRGMAGNAGSGNGVDWGARRSGDKWWEMKLEGREWGRQIRGSSLLGARTLLCSLSCQYPAPGGTP